MSAGFAASAVDEPHLEGESAAPSSDSTSRPSEAHPPRVAVDKRADCTTVLVLDVEAPACDRTTVSCGEKMRWRR